MVMRRTLLWSSSVVLVLLLLTAWFQSYGEDGPTSRENLASDMLKQDVVQLNVWVKCSREPANWIKTSLSSDELAQVEGDTGVPAVVQKLGHVPVMITAEHVRRMRVDRFTKCGSVVSGVHVVGLPSPTQAWIFSYRAMYVPPEVSWLAQDDLPAELSLLLAGSFPVPSGGIAMFSALPGAKYEISIETPEGVRDAVEAVPPRFASVDSGQVSIVPFIMAPHECPLLYGIVVNEGGEPVRGALVRVVEKTYVGNSSVSQDVAVATTRRDGVFVISGSRPEPAFIIDHQNATDRKLPSFSLLAQSVDALGRPVRGVLPIDSWTDRVFAGTIKLHDNVARTVTVTTAGVPHANANITLSLDGWFHLGATTDSDGRARIEGLPRRAGRYRAIVEAKGAKRVVVDATEFVLFEDREWIVNLEADLTNDGHTPGNASLRVVPSDAQFHDMIVARTYLDGSTIQNETLVRGSSELTGHRPGRWKVFGFRSFPSQSTRFYEVQLNQAKVSTCVLEFADAPSAVFRGNPSEKVNALTVSIHTMEGHFVLGSYDVRHYQQHDIHFPLPWGERIVLRLIAEPSAVPGFKYADLEVGPLKPGDTYTIDLSSVEFVS